MSSEVIKSEKGEMNELVLDGTDKQNASLGTPTSFQRDGFLDPPVKSPESSRVGAYKIFKKNDLSYIN